MGTNAITTSIIGEISTSTVAAAVEGLSSHASVLPRTLRFIFDSTAQRTWIWDDSSEVNPEGSLQIVKRMSAALGRAALMYCVCDSEPVAIYLVEGGSIRDGLITAGVPQMWRGGAQRFPRDPALWGKVLKPGVTYDELRQAWPKDDPTSGALAVLAGAFGASDRWLALTAWDVEDEPGCFTVTFGRDAEPRPDVRQRDGAGRLLLPRVLCGRLRNVRRDWRRICRIALAAGSWAPALTGIEWLELNELDGDIMLTSNQSSQRTGYMAEEIISPLINMTVKQNLDASHLGRLVFEGLDHFWCCLGTLSLPMVPTRRETRHEKWLMLRKLYRWRGELLQCQPRFRGSNGAVAWPSWARPFWVLCREAGVPITEIHAAMQSPPESAFNWLDRKLYEQFGARQRP